MAYELTDFRMVSDRAVIAGSKPRGVPRMSMIAGFTEWYLWVCGPARRGERASV